MKVDFCYVIRRLNTFGNKVFYLMNEESFHPEDVDGWVTEVVESAKRFDSRRLAKMYLVEWCTAKPEKNAAFEIVKVLFVDGEEKDEAILIEQKSPLDMAVLIYSAHRNALPAFPDGELVLRKTALLCAFVTVRFVA